MIQLMQMNTQGEGGTRSLMCSMPPSPSASASPSPVPVPGSLPASLVSALYTLAITDIDKQILCVLHILPQSGQEEIYHVIVNEAALSSSPSPSPSPVLSSSPRVYVHSVDEFLVHLHSLSHNERFFLSSTEFLPLCLPVPSVIASAVSMTSILSIDESVSLSVSSLSSYIRLLLLSFSALYDRQFLASRLAAAESVGHLLTLLFSLQQKIRPPYTVLERELTKQEFFPFSSQAAALNPQSDSSCISSSLSLSIPGSVVWSCLSALSQGDDKEQRNMFRMVLSLCQSFPHLSRVLCQYSESQLSRLRGMDGMPVDHSVSSVHSLATLKILNYVNRQHSLRYTLVRRLNGGHAEGAYLVRRSEDRDTTSESMTKSSEAPLCASPEYAVLKWSNNRSMGDQVLSAAQLVHQMVSVGYPTPDYLVVGLSPSGYPYHLQAYVDNSTPLSQMTVPLLHSLLAAIDLQRNRHPVSAKRNSNEWNHKILFSHPDLHSVITSHSTELAQFHDRIMALASQYQHHPLSSHDVVHGDMNKSNILVHKETAALQAIVDTEGMGCGSVCNDIANVLSIAVNQVTMVDSESREKASTAVQDNNSLLDIIYSCVSSVHQPAEWIIAMSTRMLVEMRYVVYRSPAIIQQMISKWHRVLDHFATQSNNQVAAHQASVSPALIDPDPASNN